MNKLVVFDFDGVLLPNTAKIIETHVRVAKEMGLALTRESLINNWGKKWATELLDSAIKDMGGWPQGAKEEFMKRTLATYINSSENPFPNIKKELADIKADKAVISSREKETLEVVLKQLEITNDFIFIQAAEDSEYTKPNPLVFANLFDFIYSNGNFYDHVWYIGDTLKYDYNAIKIYEHIKFVGVVSCLVSRQEFERAGVLLVVDSLSELPQIINSY